MKKLFYLFLINSFTFATPLDEIFKDVEVSGSICYRYEMKQEKNIIKKCNNIKTKHRHKLQ